MSSTEDDDYTIKLDANIEVETLVRNRFEEFEDLCFNDPFSNHYTVSSDDEQIETSVDSSQTPTESYREQDNTASSDVSENYASAVSDVSAESTDSMAADAPPVQETVKEEASSSSSKEVTYFFDSRLKYVNCKELIIFCIDMSSDMEKLPFVVTEESKHSPLSMVKRAIGMFVHNKQFIDKKHEYALMVMYDSATWVCEFTSNPNQLIDALEDLTETVDCKSCDLSSIVSLVIEKYPFIIASDFQSTDINHVFRIILIYGRSNCMVDFSDPTARDMLLDYPSLFLDIVYLHEPQSEENKCTEIYEALCNLDEREKSYIFEAARSVTNLHNVMGKLLSHPLQRPAQKNINYKLQDIISPEQKEC